MQYFLAYEKNNNELVKIDNSSLISASSNFMDILSFTLKYDSLIDLKNDLYKNRLLPKGFYSIYYCMQTNKKDKTTVKKLLCPYLVFKDKAKYFEPSFIKTYFFQNEKNIEFINSLLNHYLRRLGVVKLVKQELEVFYTMDKYRLLNELNRLKDIVLDSTLKIEIENIINVISQHLNDDYSLADEIDYIIELILGLQTEFVNYYSKIRANLIKNKKITESPIVSEIYRIRAKYYYGQSTKDYYEPISSSENLDNLIKLILFKYDYLKDGSGKYIIKNGKKQKGFIVENGNFVLKSRDLYDIGNFLITYDKKFEKKTTIVEDLIKEHRDEKEEFLTEDDYKYLNRM